MTTEQLEQANSIQQQIDAIQNKIHKYEGNIKWITRRMEKEHFDMEIEVSLPCNNNTIDVVNNIIQTCNVELEFLKAQFNSI